ncbi:metalloregulator ArsR/SmtB family transcription factor [Celerinatantimonas sp. YJH-8]|uniref:metalloregulator ArsR/SmtB family transcription factor n=1 Tax=Celerinatantimonas sp. YJH-8 TaxID=3228714 RepID=UPI0038CA32B2
MQSPVDLFKLLADDTRLKSLLLLSEHGSLCVCELQTALALSQPKVSRHLAMLRELNLVSDERRGKWIHYRLHPQLPEWIAELLHKTAQLHPDYLQHCHQRLAACGPARCETRS